MDQPPGNGAPSTPIWEQPEFVEKMGQMIATVTNSAIGARLKTFEKQAEVRNKESSDAILKKLEEFGTTVTANAGGKKKNKDGEEPVGDEHSTAFKSLQRQIETMKTEAAATKAERDTERAKSKALGLQQQTREGLAKYGITDPIRAKHALAVLHERLGHDEDDRPAFKDANGDFLDLDTGLKSWAASEEGKYFLPPTGARGSGDRPGQGAKNPNGAPTSSEPSMADLGMAIVREFGGVPVG